MSGVTILGELLRADAAVLEMIAEAQIKAGALPENAPLPALLLRTVSLVDHQPLKRGAFVRSAARIAVTVRAANYGDQTKAIRLVRTCCAGRTGDLSGFRRVSILTAGLGPDLRGPGNSFEQTQDFRVSFDAPA